MIKFTDLVEESYLDSNNAPLYHYTNIIQFIDIFEKNILNRGDFENPINKENLKIVSLTRNPKLDMSYYKFDLDVVLELNKDLLMKNYKIIPYDYFINKGVEDNPKSSLKRKEPFEFEEIILSDVSNLDRYLISINFINNSIFYKDILNILPKIKDKNIKIYNNGKEF